MKSEMFISSCPVEEEPVCVQNDGSHTRESRAECAIFRDQLLREFGDPPGGRADLHIKPQEHDFGVYHVVVCRFEDGNKEQTEYAYKLEAEMPTKWDEEANAARGRRTHPHEGYAVQVGDELKHLTKEQHIQQHAEGLDDSEIEAMVFGDQDVHAADGCHVEPDGRCEHGYPSPLITLNLM